METQQIYWILFFYTVTKIASCAETQQIYGAQLQQAQNDRTLFSQNAIGATANGGVNRTRVRARRGQATDPHSIAERVKLSPHSILQVQTY